MPDLTRPEQSALYYLKGIINGMADNENTKVENITYRRAIEQLEVYGKTINSMFERKIHEQFEIGRSKAKKNRERTNYEWHEMLDRDAELHRLYLSADRTDRDAIYALYADGDAGGRATGGYASKMTGKDFRDAVELQLRARTASPWTRYWKHEDVKLTRMMNSRKAMKFEINLKREIGIAIAPLHRNDMDQALHEEKMGLQDALEKLEKEVKRGREQECLHTQKTFEAMQEVYLVRLNMLESKRKQMRDVLVQVGKREKWLGIAGKTDTKATSAKKRRAQGEDDRNTTGAGPRAGSSGDAATIPDDEEDQAQKPVAKSKAWPAGARKKGSWLADDEDADQEIEEQEQGNKTPEEEPFDLADPKKMAEMQEEDDTSGSPGSKEDNFLAADDEIKHQDLDKTETETEQDEE